MRARTTFALILPALLVGCGGDQRAFSSDEGASATGQTSAEEATGADSLTDDGDDAAEEAGSDTTGPLLDAAGTAEGGGNLDSCNAVDLLFVIDNSPSMGVHQEALVAAFPSFIDAIYASLPAGVDIHVGITTSSFSDDVGRSCDIGCLWYSNACGTEAEFGCDRDGCYQDVAASANGSRGRLFEYEGKRYFETNTASDDQAALTEWFVGAASAVGEMGNNYEFMSAAASWAVGPQAADTNVGFVRDEGAVLFLFFLTNQWDESIQGLDEYVAGIEAAKQQCNATIEDGNCVVAAGLIDDCTVPDANGGNASAGFGDWDAGGKGPGGNAGDMLWQLMATFSPEPIWGSIESANYGEVVGDALAGVIFDTCEAIPPVD